ncbi:MAG: MBL fold metallo-hydrolase [Clostridia bacterium]|nr:MBL fold metallo-hydrolase [Clostridia bacterium]
MIGFYKETDDVYRLRIPFENLYTSVFLIIADGKKMLVDCGTTANDVDTFIVPLLAELGVTLTDIETLVLTHKHGDHAGGLARVCEIAPNIEVVTDVRVLTGKISTYPLAGHTDDSIGVLDEKSHTLISGDGLQGAGVDKYRCNVKNKEAYLKTLERIKNDGRIENIFFSHAYEPFYKDFVLGRSAVENCLSECKKYVKE